jgi:hypothetical protein
MNFLTLKTGQYSSRSLIAHLEEEKKRSPQYLQNSNIFFCTRTLCKFRGLQASLLHFSGKNTFTLLHI